MKKYILSILLLPAVFACNETSIPPGSTPPAITDSAGAKPDAGKAVNEINTIGSGLTLEEMRDDSVFTDGSIPTSWGDAGFTDVKGFKLFLKQLQLLVLNNEKEQVARFIKYPLGKSVKTEKDFIDNYDRIFTKEIKLSIASIEFSQIFRNSKGAMSEDGKVWFSQEGNEFKIIAVNF